MKKSESKSLLIKNKDKFNLKLQQWFKKNKRKLPWRNHPTLYKTVVSEFMLQQTQVNTVINYFDNWIKVFPNFKTLALASENKVIKQWEGLGYYARARNLHKLSKIVLSFRTIPKVADDWLKLPGIGQYTAAAVTSIQFNAKEACVDGNIVRILTRLTSDKTVYKNNTAPKLLQPLASKIINENFPGSHNEAMMELGATICIKSKPLCSICPVSDFCHSYQYSAQNEYPKLEKKKIVKLEVNRAWLIHENLLLLNRYSSNSGRLSNFYELPTIEDLKITFTKKDFIVQKSRGISNQKFMENIYRVKANRSLIKLIKSTDHFFWQSKSNLNSIPISGPHRRWINEILNKS